MTVTRHTITTCPFASLWIVCIAWTFVTFFDWAQQPAVTQGAQHRAKYGSLSYIFLCLILRIFRFSSIVPKNKNIWKSIDYINLCPTHGMGLKLCFDLTQFITYASSKWTKTMFLTHSFFPFSILFLLTVFIQNNLYFSFSDSICFKKYRQRRYNPELFQWNWRIGGHDMKQKVSLNYRIHKGQKDSTPTGNRTRVSSVAGTYAVGFR